MIPALLAVTAPIQATVDRVAADTLARQGLPGIAILIARDGHIVVSKGYGFRYPDDRVAMKGDTLVDIGSVTKQFTASAIMLLVQEKKLSLDDRLSTYLPDVDHADEVTIRQLLNMTSGLRDFLEQAAEDGIDLTWPRSERAVLQIVHGYPLNFAAGSQYSYCNTGYFILGMLIEKLSRESYEDFVRQHFFKPLRLQSARFLSTTAVVANHAQGYTNPTMLHYYHAPLLDSSTTGAAGNIVMALPDLERWNLALRGGRVVSKESYREMTTPTVLTGGGHSPYALGLFVSKLGRHRMVVHEGGTFGTLIIDATFPDDDTDILVVGNSIQLQGNPVLLELIKAVFPDLELPKPSPSPAEPPDAALDARARAWLSGALAGRADRRRFQRVEAATVDESALVDFGSIGARYGAPRSVTFDSVGYRVPTTTYFYRVAFASTTLFYTYGEDQKGQIAALSLAPYYH